MTDRKILSPTVVALVFALLALATLCGAPPAWAQTVAGSISAISGTATITRGGTTIPAAYGTNVEVGDRIVTAAASSVTITLSDSSQVEVTDSSTMTLDENTLNPNGTRANTKLSLVTGLVRSLVRTTPGTPPNFEVHTPNAVASARGTGFDVDHETGVQDDKFKGCTEFSHVSVFQGTVDVSNPTNPSSPTVEVHEGHKVTVPCGGAPILSGIGWGSTAALGALGLLGGGGLAVGIYGAAGGFGGGNHHGPVSPVQ